MGRKSSWIKRHKIPWEHNSFLEFFFSYTCAYKYVLWELLGHNFAKSHGLRKFKFLCKTVCILVKTTKKRCLLIKWTPSPVVVSYMGAQLAVRRAGLIWPHCHCVRLEVYRIQIERGGAFIVL